MNRRTQRIVTIVLLAVLAGFIAPRLFPVALGADLDDSNWEVMSAQLPGVDRRIDAFATLGNRLYAGGRFRLIGGLVTSGIAAWDRTRWSALGSGIDGGVSALHVSGADLIVGGSFARAGGVAAVNVARWNGQIWSALGNLTSQPQSSVLALAEFQRGDLCRR